MITDLFDYFGSEEEIPQQEIALQKEVVFCDKIKPTNNTLSFEDGNDFANAIGNDDYYDADGDYSEVRGKKRGMKRKGVVKRKPIRPISVKNTKVVALGTGKGFDKKVLKALDNDKFFNARGGRGGGHRGGGGRHHGGGRRGGFRRGGGYFWNGAYWVDGSGLCYTKNWLGNYTLVNCGVIPSVAFGL